MPQAERRSQLQSLAQAIVDGTANLDNTALGLSKEQIQLLRKMRKQLKSIGEIERLLKEYRVDRDALETAHIPIKHVVLLGFQPPFGLPSQSLQSGTTFRQLHPGFAKNLRDRRDTGLSPASISNTELRSADGVPNAVVSVNAVPPTRGIAEKVEHYADYLSYNRANGALPVAIELSGDDNKVGLPTAAHTSILEARAFASALFVIDGGQLSSADQNIVAEAEGEAGISNVPASAIVCVLVSSAASHIMGNDTMYVPETVGRVYSAAYKSHVTIAHPDYQMGLTALLKRNPERTMICHVTRLGHPAVKLK